MGCRVHKVQLVTGLFVSSFIRVCLRLFISGGITGWRDLGSMFQQGGEVRSYSVPAFVRVGHSHPLETGQTLIAADFLD